MGSKEVLVGTRERDLDSLLPGDSTNNTILHSNGTLKSQPCFVCSFRWVLNGVESSSNEEDKRMDGEGQIEERGGVVKSRVGTADSDTPGGGDEGGDMEDSTVFSGEEAKEFDASKSAGLQVGNGKMAIMSNA